MGSGLFWVLGQAGRLPWASVDDGIGTSFTLHAVCGLLPLGPWLVWRWSFIWLCQDTLGSVPRSVAKGKMAHKAGSTLGQEWCGQDGRNSGSVCLTVGLLSRLSNETLAQSPRVESLLARGYLTAQLAHFTMAVMAYTASDASISY